MKTELKKLPKSQVEIDFQLDEQEFSKYIERALEHLKSHAKMDGFRPGTVPKDIVEKKIGQENLLMEAGDMAVRESYTRFINENNLEPIGEPEVQIKKIAKGSELLFTVKVALLPDVQLPDYREIAKTVKGQEIAVDEKEIQEALEYLQKSRAKFSQADRGAQAKDFVEIEYVNQHIQGGKAVKDRFILGEGGFMKDFEDNIAGMKAGEEKEFKAKFPENTPDKAIAGKLSDFRVKVLSVQNMELPKMDDEFAKGLGMFDSLAALKKNLHEGITMEKQENEKQRKRGELLSTIAQKTAFELPEKMVQYEQERLLEDLKNQIAHGTKVSFEEYLASIKKTEEEIRNSFKQDAERRIKNFLVLRGIGKQENIEVSKQELEEKMNEELRRYTKEQTEKIDIGQLKEYTKGAIFNEKVFQFLETLSH